MNKRGISPLIASVLLIAFTIILFATITLWIRNSAVNPAMQETEDKIASDLEAMSTKIEVSEASVIGDKAKLTVTNIGDTDIKGFNIRVIGSSGVDVVQVQETLNQLDTVTKEINFSLSKTGSVNRIEVIPILTSGLAISATSFETDFNTKDTSLIAYYAFEGNANDLSGNGNNGVIYGADCNVNGRIGKACSFDGVDDNIQITSNSNLRGMSQLTISVWAYANNYPTASDENQLIRAPNYHLAVLGSSYSTPNSIYSIIYNNSVGGYTEIFGATNSFTTGAWHHAVLSFNGIDTILYVDGVQKGGSSGFVGTMSTNIGVIYIGSAASSQYWNGTIDEVKIYNRALSEEEIKALAG